MNEPKTRKKTLHQYHLLGSEIKKIRKSIKIPLGAFSQAVGVSANYISQIESGRRRPAYSKINRISKILKSPHIIELWRDTHR